MISGITAGDLIKQWLFHDRGFAFLVVLVIAIMGGSSYVTWRYVVYGPQPAEFAAAEAGSSPTSGEAPRKEQPRPIRAVVEGIRPLSGIECHAEPDSGFQEGFIRMLDADGGRQDVKLICGDFPPTLVGPSGTGCTVMP